MWKNEERAHLIRNIIYGVLAAAILAGLFIAYKIVSAKNNAIDAQLSEAHTQQQEQQVAEKQENLAAVQNEYQKDLDTITQYMPGIVCWGDATTAGTTGNVSYPATLQAYIDTYITGVYTFSDSMPNAETYTGIEWDTYDVSIPVANMGAGKQNTQTVMGRSGVATFKLTYSVTIPADCTPVNVYFTAQDGTTVDPLNGGDLGVNPVTLGGIVGTLSMDSSGHYSFTRQEAGEETALEAGAELSTAGLNYYSDYIHVICVGTYDTDVSADKLVENVKTILARQTQNSDRYIVLGPWYIGSQWVYTDTIDTAMTQAFGSHYINARKYLSTDALTDANITATANDTQAAKQGVVPYSLRSSAGNGELTGSAYKLLGKLIYERMDELGYFDEIKSELAIDISTKALLADNPNYFTQILAAKGY